MKFVLAVDIERAGPTVAFDTIAIGAVVLRYDNFEEQDRLFLPGYFPQQTKFDKDYMDRFWSKHIATLNSLTYHGSSDVRSRQLEMITEFQAFRFKWEEHCEKHNAELILVSDNPLYDGGFLSHMITEHLPDSMPLPYSIKTASYETIYDTYTALHVLRNFMARGFLCGGNFDQLTTREIAARLYQLPQRMSLHTHNPADDAYGAAYDYCMTMAIFRGEVKRRDV